MNLPAERGHRALELLSVPFSPDREMAPGEWRTWVSLAFPSGSMASTLVDMGPGGSLPAGAQVEVVSGPVIRHRYPLPMSEWLAETGVAIRIVHTDDPRKRWLGKERLVGLATLQPLGDHTRADTRPLLHSQEPRLKRNQALANNGFRWPWRWTDEGDGWHSQKFQDGELWIRMADRERSYRERNARTSPWPPQQAGDLYPIEFRSFDGMSYTWPERPVTGLLERWFAGLSGHRSGAAPRAWNGGWRFSNTEALRYLKTIAEDWVLSGMPGAEPLHTVPEDGPYR